MRTWPGKQMILLQQGVVNGRGGWSVGQGKAPRNYRGRRRREHYSALQRHVSGDSYHSSPGSPHRGVLSEDCWQLIAGWAGMGNGTDV